MGRRSTPKPDLHVGDDYELENHCMVAFPDGSVVTASRSIKLVQPGKYRIIPNDPKKAERTIFAKKNEA